MNYMEMAREAEEYAAENAVYIHKNCEVAEFEYHELLYRKFAELVAAHEREECAKLVFRLDLYGVEMEAAKAIRARGTT